MLTSLRHRDLWHIRDHNMKPLERPERGRWIVWRGRPVIINSSALLLLRYVEACLRKAKGPRDGHRGDWCDKHSILEIVLQVSSRALDHAVDGNSDEFLPLLLQLRDVTGSDEGMILASKLDATESPMLRSDGCVFLLV